MRCAPPHPHVRDERGAHLAPCSTQLHNNHAWPTAYYASHFRTELDADGARELLPGPPLCACVASRVACPARKPSLPAGSGEPLVPSYDAEHPRGGIVQVT